MKFFIAQSEGDIKTMQSMVSEDFQYTLNGQLDISKTYYGWDEFLRFMGEFGNLLKGSVGVEFLEIIPSENSAIILAKGKMEGVAGKYENEYALKYTLNKDGRIKELFRKGEFSSEEIGNLCLAGMVVIRRRFLEEIAADFSAKKRKVTDFVADYMTNKNLQSKNIFGCRTFDLSDFNLHKNFQKRLFTSFFLRFTGRNNLCSVCVLYE